MKTFATLFLFLLTSISGFGQLQVTQNLTPAQLISQVLIGYGVTVSNVTYTGDTQAIGKFANGGTTNIGLLSGVLMTTGKASIAIGPNNSTSAGFDNSGLSDPQLASLVTTSINDASVLEFDFVPIADTVKFRYVFGSDEYPEFSISSYNDVFGFFISGPNPNGGTYTNLNMATLPNSTTPVSINNINNGNSGTGPCTNCTYYIDNSNGFTIQYDAFTVVLEAWAVVTPCMTYHFKAAIGDAGDGVYDSGVFLEAGSFSTNAVQVSTGFTIPGAIQKCIEGCNDAEIKVQLPKTLAYPYTVYIDTMWGTATNGVDFTHIPDSIVVPAGQLSASLLITPLIDNNIEGQEYWHMIFQTSPCTMDTVTIPIIDYTPIELTNHQNDTMVCSDSLRLNLYPTFGWPNSYNITWNPASSVTHPDALSSWAMPPQTTQYIVGISDSSGCPTVYDTINVEVNPKVLTSFIPDIFQGCEPIDVTFSDMSAPNIVSWKWYFGDGDSSALQNPSHTYNAGIFDVKLIATSSSGCYGELLVTNLIHSWPLPNANFYLDPSVTTIDNPTINFVNTTQGGNSWLWKLGDGTTATTENITHTYPGDGEFEVWLIATSDKGCVDSVLYLANVIVDEIEVPNVITPNGDGSNDKFVIKNIDKLESSELRIYNRWGTLIYHSKNYNNDWDGNGAADGVYYWQIDYKTYFKEATEKGTLTIIR